jgi:15-cis-phytoene synthase
MSARSRAVLEAGAAEARAGLSALYARLREAGYAAPRAVEGQLIRPLLCLAGARGLRLPEDATLWSAAAALQLAHEASLLHDDVIDDAAVRRGRPTLVAARGVAAALVEGDHLLTTSYRLAATSSASFVVSFAHAVERTVAGEKLQGQSTGLVLDERSYRRIVGQKSGELLGCALAAAALTAGDAHAVRLYALGRSIGTLYQMLDDLLDYCPAADTGKPPLADYRQRRWTWPLIELDAAGAAIPIFADDAEAIAHRFATADGDTAPLQRCLRRYRREADLVRAAIAIHLPHDEIATALVADWTRRAEDAVARMERAQDAATRLERAQDAATRLERAQDATRMEGAQDTVARTERDRHAVARMERARQAATRTERDDALRALLRRRVPERRELDAFFGRNSRSFSFAARLFPVPVRTDITALYAFCRVSDDLADASVFEGEALDGSDRLRLLDAWQQLARSAWRGERTGIPLLDDVMATAAAAAVPFRLVEELLEGMRMDVRGTRYETLADLRTYSYRVAGVVGEWVTRLCGVHDLAMLRDAAALGHAMQLTNILRDVGEDLRAGRIYLPAETMAAFGLSEAQLHEFAGGRPIDDAWARMVEQLMSCADADYDTALQAAAALPPFFRRPVVVAAHVYRGIHDDIRRNGYDTFNRRARTGTLDKLWLAGAALSGKRLARHDPAAGPAPEHALGSVHATTREAARGPAHATTRDPAPGSVHATTREPARETVRPRPARDAFPTVAGCALAVLLAGAAVPAAAQSDPVSAGQRARATSAQPVLTPAAHRERLDAAVAASPHDPALRLDLIRALFFSAVDDARAVHAGHAELSGLRAVAPRFADEHAALLLAYDGAFAALEAKHGSWPPARLGAVRRGLQSLDSAVQMAPAAVEVRYLRLVNTHYLPAIFGRRDSARDDMRAVAGLLLVPVAGTPDEMRAVMIRFVLDHAALRDDEASRLHRALEDARPVTTGP